MNGWIIGLSLAGAFGGAAVGTLNEMTKDWNGGQRQKGDVKRMTKATLTGAALGAGFGWMVFGHSASPQRAAMDDCYKNAPAGATVSVTTSPGGKAVCSYSKP
jgi:hypothetical protein